jgi:CDP-diacylglycerol--serine O-phosphatidyltransferase
MGFISLILIIEQYNRLALSLYLFVLLFDRLDGFVARKYGITSEFCKELDSLADAFNFCFFPVVIAYLWGFNAWWMVMVFGVHCYWHRVFMCD